MSIISYLRIIFFRLSTKKFLCTGSPGPAAEFYVNIFVVWIGGHIGFLHFFSTIDPIFLIRVVYMDPFKNSPKSHVHCQPSWIPLFSSDWPKLLIYGFAWTLHVTKFVMLISGHLKFFYFFADWPNFKKYVFTWSHLKFPRKSSPLAAICISLIPPIEHNFL